MFKDKGGYTNQWTWRCNAKDGNTDCFAHKHRPEAGQCGTSVNSCLKGTLDTVQYSLENGRRWKCKGNY